MFRRHQSPHLPRLASEQKPPLSPRFDDRLLEGASNTYFSTNLNIANASKLVQDSDAIFRRAIAKDAIGEFQSKEIANEASEQTRVSVVMLCGRENTDLIRALGKLAAEALSSAAANNLPSFSPDERSILILGALTSQAEPWRRLWCKRSRLISPVRTGKDPPDKQAAAKELLNAVVLHTKQLRHMSVLLVSSDERLPFHIRNLGVNPCHITHTFVINEPTPRECLDLMQKQFGVGEHLSSALLDCYGGNLPHAYESVESTIDIFMGPATDNGNAPYQWKTEEGGEAEIRKVLEELARTGFVPMQSTSKLAQLLAKLNICVFLTEAAEEYQAA
eukprot:gene24157-29218_t